MSQKMIETLFPVNFSDSMMSDVWQCEMLFFRKYCQRLAHPGKNHHLIAGNHFAKACEIVRKAYYNNGYDTYDAVEQGQNYILEADDTGDSIKSNERLSFVLQKYFERFPLEEETKPVTLSDGTHAIEYKFLFDIGIPHPDIPEQNICFTGKLDALYTKVFPGGRTEIFILDEKTTSRLARLKDGSIDYEKELDKYRVKGQFITYAWAASQLGVLVDRAVIRRVPVLQKHEQAFEVSMYINPFMIAQWAWATKNKIEELIEKYKYFKRNQSLPAHSFYPTYQLSCNSFDRLCPFAQGCMSEEGESVLTSMYRQVVWDSDTQKEWDLVNYKKHIGIL